MNNILLWSIGVVIMKVECEVPRKKKKGCPTATLSITNHTWTCQGSNPDLCSEAPVSELPKP